MAFWLSPFSFRRRFSLLVKFDLILLYRLSPMLFFLFFPLCPFLISPLSLVPHAFSSLFSFVLLGSGPEGDDVL